MTTPDAAAVAAVTDRLLDYRNANMREPMGNPFTVKWIVPLVFEALAEAGFVVIPDEPNHYVNFDQAGWFIVHSVACRVAGTLGTCEYNEAIRKIAEDFDPDDDPDQLGLWRITNIDSEGLPSLVKEDRDAK